MNRFYFAVVRIHERHESSPRADPLAFYSRKKRSNKNAVIRLLSVFQVLLTFLIAHVRTTARILLGPICGQVHNSGPESMKTTVTMTDENVAGSPGP
jgi:hypothetical protein